jgi:DNA-binding protein H-NS
MASINVDKMSLKDLLELEVRVQKAIMHAKQRERTELKQKMIAMAENAGFTLAELVGGGRGSALKGGKVAPKYMNPDNKNETWTGRGRKPRWLAAKLSKGGKIDDFRI